MGSVSQPFSELPKTFASYVLVNIGMYIHNVDDWTGLSELALETSVNSRPQGYKGAVFHR